MLEEETLEGWQDIQGFKDVISTSAPDPVVLKAKSLQVGLVTEHGRELTHGVVIQIVVVKEDLLEGRVVDEVAGDGLQAQIPDKVALQGESGE